MMLNFLPTDYISKFYTKNNFLCNSESQNSNCECNQNLKMKNRDTFISLIRLQYQRFLYVNLWIPTFLSGLLDFCARGFLPMFANSILCYKGVQYYFTDELRVRADRPSVSGSTPELHTLFYAILCVKFDITRVRTEMRNHPRQSEMAGHIEGKRVCMGVRSGSRGAGGEAPAGGLGAEPPPPTGWTILFYFG